MDAALDQMQDAGAGNQGDAQNIGEEDARPNFFSWFVMVRSEDFFIVPQESTDPE